MKRFNDIIKGFLIGIANIIPGVSGGTIAVVTGIYDQLIYNISQFFSHPIKAIKSLIFIATGIVLGVASGYFLIGKLLLPLLPMEMCFLFSGLIIGGIKPIFDETKKEKPTVISSLLFLFAFLSLIALAIVKICVHSSNNAFNFDFVTVLLVFMLGAIAAIAMIVPGVSGSIILLAMGYYQSIIDLISNAMKEFFTFNFHGQFILLLAFALGVVLALVFVSKIINYLIKKYHHVMYSMIFGLVSSSAIATIILGIYECNWQTPLINFFHIFGSIVLFIIGLFLGVLMSKMDKKEIDFMGLAANYSNDALEDLQTILRFPSVLDEYHENSDVPFGINNKECLEAFLSMGLRDGLTTKNVDNYAGHISLGDSEEIIGILGHLDVVPAVGKWSNDPFTPTISDGKLYARGALDDKGGVIAAYYAMRIIKDLNIPLNKQIRLIAGCDEETGSRCLQHYFKYEPLPTMAFSPDAEFPVIYGEKGILSFDINGTIENEEVISIKAGIRYNIVIDEAVLTVKKTNSEYLKAFVSKYGCSAEVKDNSYYFYGKAAHAMQPDEGINAAYLMFNFMNEYYPCQIAEYISRYFDTTGEKQNIAIDDLDMHKLTINLGIVDYQGKRLRLGYNLRVPVDEHVECIRSGFNNALKEFDKLSLGEFSYSPRHFVSADSPLVVNLMEAYRSISGDTVSKPFTIGGGTYARILDNAVAFGPNFLTREDVCHQPDEHIYLEDFTKWIAIYAKAIYLLLVK